MHRGSNQQEISHHFRIPCEKATLDCSSWLYIVVHYDSFAPDWLSRMQNYVLLARIVVKIVYLIF